MVEKLQILYCRHLMGLGHNKNCVLGHMSMSMEVMKLIFAVLDVIYINMCILSFIN